MSCLKLIVSDTLELGFQEAQPCAATVNLELWDLAQSQVRHVGCEGLIEPQIIPPLHGYQISEPHMGQFVQNNNHLLSLFTECNSLIFVE